MNGFKAMIAALSLVAVAVSAQATPNTTGDTTYGSAGTSTKKIGSTTYVRDRHGNTTTYNMVGGTIIGSDGSTMKKIGNTTYINDGHGNITQCNVVGSSM
ncbi:hypothetical protein ACLEW0_20375 [Enterobacter ludwigii]|uniref:hypothetical protein n=1 Tax=Enterobacter ludwigii TaxID=299767 RepID=UPI003975FE1D